MTGQVKSDLLIKGTTMGRFAHILHQKLKICEYNMTYSNTFRVENQLNKTVISQLFLFDHDSLVYCTILVFIVKSHSLSFNL